MIELQHLADSLGSILHAQTDTTCFVDGVQIGCGTLAVTTRLRNFNLLILARIISCCVRYQSFNIYALGSLHGSYNFKLLKLLNQIFLKRNYVV